MQTGSGGRRAAIVGLGLEGSAAVEYLAGRDDISEIRVLDRRSLAALPAQAQELVERRGLRTDWLGDRWAEGLATCDVVLRSPGIPATDPFLIAAREAGVTVSSGTAIFLERHRGRTIGITGTKGKSTTASLIGDILAEAGLRAPVIGNIGTPALTHIDRNDVDWFVVELSAAQLSDVSNSPRVAVILNLYEEHLDHFGSPDNYYAAKGNLWRWQAADDWLIWNVDDVTVRDCIRNARGAKVGFGLRMAEANATVRNGKIEWSYRDTTDVICDREEIQLPGEFNLYNVLAAVAVSGVVEVMPDTVRRGILSYRMLPNRLEEWEARGIRFVDGALATVPEATMAHLAHYGDQVDTLIVGGFDRGVGYGELAAYVVRSSVRTVICLGPAGNRIAGEIEVLRESTRLEVLYAESLAEAVNAAFAKTRRGRVCLHSPAAASFDAFRDYKARAAELRRLSNELASGVGENSE